MKKIYLIILLTLISENLMCLENWRFYNPSNSGLSSTDIKVLEIDNNDNIWIGTKTKGIYFFNKYNWVNYDTKNHKDLIDIRAICFDKDEKTWTGTSVGLLSKDGDSWQKYKDFNPKILWDYPVMSAYVDKNNIKWFGTENGLAKIDGDSLFFYDMNNSEIPQYYITAIHQDKNNVLWLGTEYNGLIRFDGNEWKNYDMKNSPIPHTFVKDIASDSNNVLWIATGNGLANFDGLNWQVFNKTNSQIPDNEIESIEFFGNTFWGAGSWYGLVKFEDNIWTSYNKNNSELPTNNLKKLAIDKLGNIWIATRDSGVCVFNENGIVAVEDDNITESSNINILAYPNPATDRTTIHYYLDNNEYIHLDLYDSSGGLVKSLESGYKSAGFGTLDIFTAGLSSGTYFVKMKSAKGEETSLKIIIYK